MKLPLARHKNIIVQELSKEILIYDLDTHKAYSLNETSSIVYKACDGKTAFEEFRIRNKFTDEIIYLALDELRKENLIEANDDSYVSPFTGMSRREAIKKVGLSSMVVMPGILAVVSPTPEDARSAPACIPVNTAGDCKVTPCCPGSECSIFNSDGDTYCRAT